MEIFVIDPASITRSHMAMWAALTATASVSAFIVALMNRKSWLLIFLAVGLVPTLATLPFGARLEFSWSYVSDIVLPIAIVLGTPSAVVGLLLGLVFRRCRDKIKRA